MALPSLLKELGVDPLDVLAEAQIDPQVFGNPDNIISFASRVRLLNICARRAAVPHFGLLLAQTNSLQNFGLVGCLALYSADVESAFRSLIRFLHLHVQGASVSLELNEDVAFLGYDVYLEVDEDVSCLVEAGVAVAFKILNELCGCNCGVLEVCFSHRKPEDIAPYKRYFDAPLRFNAEKNGVFFPRKCLTQKVQVADPELHRLLQIQVDQLEANFGDDFLEQVRMVVHASMPVRRCSADEIARFFSIHSRTLHRYLASRGTSFSEVKEACQFDLARQLLESSDMKLIQIAEILGYAEKRAFNRAFRRWSGLTPTRWRDTH